MKNIQTPAKSLSTFDAIAIIVGIVIGAGIFKTPSIVAVNSGSEFTVGVLITGIPVLYLSAIRQKRKGEKK